MMRLQLTVPTTAPVENPNAITSPKELAAWVEDLPYANPQVTAKLILDSLQLLVRQPGSITQLHKLMICYLPPFHNLLETAAKSTQRQHSITGHRREAQLLSLFEQVNVEMAYGFKRVVIDSNIAGANKHSQETTAEILYYAIECLALDLMLSYTKYKHASANIWREIMQLYILSERLGVSRIPVATASCEEELNTDIRLIFKRILLINLLDPYRLQREEIWSYYLLCWAQHAQITKFKERKKPTGCFLVELRGNRKPTSYDPEKPPTDPSQYLMLDTSPLNQEINQQMQALQKAPRSVIPGIKKQDPAFAESLMRTMLLAWYLHPKRRHPREERFDWLIAACGLAAIQHFLMEGNLADVNLRA